MGSLLKTCWAMVRKRACQRCGLPWSEKHDSSQLFFLLPGMAVVFVGFLYFAHQEFLEADSWATTQGQLLEARVHEGPADKGAERFEVSYRYRYEVGGAEFTDARFSGGKPRAYGLTGAEARAAVAEVTSDSTHPVYYRPEEPGRARFDLDFSQPGLWIFLALISANLACSLVDDLSKGVADLQRHHDEHGGPLEVLANFDRRGACLRQRALGPRYSCAGFVFFFGLLLTLCFSHERPWAFALVAATQLSLIGALRLLRELVVLARWRGVTLTPLEHAPFELGRTYVFRFEGSPRRWRRARLEYRVELPEEWGAWSGRVAAHVPVEVRPGELRVTLPLGVGPSLGVQPRWRHDGRERWTIALPGAVHFDLDFAPERPPPLIPLSLELPPLSLVRERLGPAPRALPEAVLAEAEAEPPDWAEGHSYAECYAETSLLLQEGVVVWGALVQANTQLFSPGDSDCPAMVLYSLDPYFDEHPGELRAMAVRLFETKDEPKDRLSHVIADEYEDVYQRPLAPWIAGEREVWASSIMVIRPHLPEGVLRGRVFPLLAAPSKTRVPLIVPSHFWSPELLATWR